MVSLVFSWRKCNYISVRLNEIYHLPSKQKLFSSSEGALEHFNYLSMVGRWAIKMNSKSTVLKGRSASTCQKHLPMGARLVFQLRNRIQTQYVLKYFTDSKKVLQIVWWCSFRLLLPSRLHVPCISRSCCCQKSGIDSQSIQWTGLFDYGAWQFGSLLRSLFRILYYV